MQSIILLLLAISSCLGERKQPQTQLPNRQVYQHFAWKDPYIKLPPKSNFQGHPVNTCWSRGGICIQLRLCPTLEFEALLPGCNRRYQVCCKVWNYNHVKNFRDVNLPSLIGRTGTGDDVPDASLDVFNNEEVRKKSIRNAYVFSKYLQNKESGILDYVDISKSWPVKQALEKKINADVPAELEEIV